LVSASLFSLDIDFAHRCHTFVSVPREDRLDALQLTASHTVTGKHRQEARITVARGRRQDAGG
jgi:hypothetical protein